MYTVLSGAKKNIGDFLITDRCKKLLMHFKPKEELFQLPHWEYFDNHIEKINNSKAIIIMGGPGFQKYFYPKIYKLTKDLSDIKVPIIPMGLGWKAFPGDEMSYQNYKFGDLSFNLLKRMSSENQYISCRDYITKNIIKNHGINNILMTGCPVWYDLESIGKKFKIPERIKNIVFSPAQLPFYKDQSIKIMKLIRNLFPDSKIICSFNRGTDSADEFTPKKDEINNRILINSAKDLGYEIKNTAFDLNNISFYDNCDLHIGYRVHSHIYFLSKRKLSFLIHEDGRGIGVSEALGIKGLNGFRRYIYSKNSFANKIIKRFFIKPNPLITHELKNLITNEIENDFSRYKGISMTIDSTFELMKTFINSLP